MNAVILTIGIIVLLVVLYFVGSVAGAIKEQIDLDDRGHDE